MTGRPADVATFGEIMGLFIAEAPGPLADAARFERRLAGAELNVAVALARLGHRVSFVGRVGEDPIGAHARARLAGEGVDVAALRPEPRANTGLQLKERVTGGADPEVVYFRRGAAGSLLAPDEQSLEAVRHARHLHLTGIPPALSASARAFSFAALEVAREVGATVSFDPNLRPTLWPVREEMVRVVDDLARRADWVFPGLAEGLVLTGRDDAEDIAAHYLDAGARGVAVKEGACGARLFTPDGSWRCPPYPVESVDSVGAGDGFAAGFVSGLLEGLDPEQCLARAAAVGALATTSPGDNEGMPTRDEVDRLLARFPSETDQPRRGAACCCR